jgi:hypothetical protein
MKFPGYGGTTKILRMNKLVLTILPLLHYYDPKVISFKELVNVFLRHKTRQPNQQGPDRGSSYRSIAFYKMQQRRKLLKILRSLQLIKCLPTLLLPK